MSEYQEKGAELAKNYADAFIGGPDGFTDSERHDRRFGFVRGWNAAGEYQEKAKMNLDRYFDWVAAAVMTICGVMLVVIGVVMVVGLVTGFE